MVGQKPDRGDSSYTHPTQTNSSVVLYKRIYGKIKRISSCNEPTVPDIVARTDLNEILQAIESLRIEQQNGYNKIEESLKALRIRIDSVAPKVSTPGQVGNRELSRTLVNILGDKLNTTRDVDNMVEGNVELSRTRFNTLEGNMKFIHFFEREIGNHS